ncbi:hypothetical protein HHI36_009242 [Cryptolaemus montrouzieri]|uniref:Fork-head domain-containing protein n=1 Tax=Cryptolaemus montrouzieri TaxID=559131 RepID=A0ABD2MVJ2_9CUCU
MVTEQNIYSYYQDIPTYSQCTDSDVDCSDGNLSWLLNYKIHELPPIPADSSGSSEEHLTDIFADTITLEFTDLDGNDFDLGNTEIIFTDEIEIKSSESETNLQETLRPVGPSKPPYTYTELIEHALSDRGELTVSGIYQWISQHYPYYKEGDDRWKNSVRHNLSINPHFRKGSKSLHGAGHLWTVAGKDAKKSYQIILQSTGNR